MAEGPDAVSPLSRGEEKYAETLLAECDWRHLSGLVNLIRFGIASGGDARGSYVTAAWMLNSASHQGLPRNLPYSRQDGTGFAHCDAEWLETRVTSDPRNLSAETGSPKLRREFFGAIFAVGAKLQKETLGDKSVAAIEGTLALQLEAGRPSALIISSTEATSFAIVLALNRRRQQLFCCEVEESRARLRWRSLELLQKRAQQGGATLELVSIAPDRASPAVKTEHAFRGQKVVYLDSEHGRELLRKAEGLSIVAYAALHGNNQRDLSSCQVASLSSLALPKGTRGRVTVRAGTLVKADATNNQQPTTNNQQPTTNNQQPIPRQFCAPWPPNNCARPKGSISAFAA